MSEQESPQPTYPSTVDEIFNRKEVIMSIIERTMPTGEMGRIGVLNPAELVDYAEYVHQWIQTGVNPKKNNRG